MSTRLKSMPRIARERSETGVYHIMVRGINRQDIFQDKEDKGVYIERLQKYKKECAFKIYAYCLMNNHVHLLIKEEEEKTADIMKKIGTSYVYWYNWKYGRIGRLFQDRYKSEVVENDSYLLTVTRYIHQNPVNVGLKIDDWTSYRDYLEISRITDTGLVLGIFNHDKERFKEFMNEKNNDICLEISEQKRLTDEDAKKIIIEIEGITHCQELQTINRELRDNILSTLKEKGLSIRQIERLTGINRGTILNA